MTTCPSCLHPVAEHSSEDGVGCLHIVWTDPEADWPLCPCTQPGTSGADQ